MNSYSSSKDYFTLPESHYGVSRTNWQYCLKHCRRQTNCLRGVAAKDVLAKYMMCNIANKTYNLVMRDMKNTDGEKKRIIRVAECC